MYIYTKLIFAPLVATSMKGSMCVVMSGVESERGADFKMIVVGGWLSFSATSIPIAAHLARGKRLCLKSGNDAPFGHNSNSEFRNELISPSSEQLILLFATASSSGMLPFLSLFHACSGCFFRYRCENKIGHLLFFQRCM